MNRGNMDDDGAVDVVETTAEEDNVGKTNGHDDHPSQNGNTIHNNTNEDEGEIAPDEDDMPPRRNNNDTATNNSNNDTFDDSTMALRPLFFGNLVPNYSTDQITKLFEHPEEFRNVLPNDISPIPIDRIDIKRGYCFVFFKDATSVQEKQRIESFCMTINGM
jgi:hypothetical protein